MTDRINRIRNLLAKIPEPIERQKDFEVHDLCGDNANDAYCMGKVDGRQKLAAQIRKILEDNTD